MRLIGPFLLFLFAMTCFAQAPKKSNPKAPAVASKKKIGPQQSCEKVHLAGLYNPLAAKDFCGFRDRVQRSTSPDYQKCAQKIRSLNGGDQAVSFCMHYDSREFSSEILTCLNQSLPLVSPWFWYFEDYASLQEARADLFLAQERLRTPRYMQRLMTECRKRAELEKTSTSARVLHQQIFHSFMAVPGTQILFGGLSGMIYEGSDLILVTDDKKNPALFRFAVDLKDENIRLQYKSRLPIHGDGRDFEGIARLQDGRFLVSSEPNEESPSEDLLFVVDPVSGVSRATVQHQDLMRKTLTQTFVCPKGMKPKQGVLDWLFQDENTKVKPKKKKQALCEETKYFGVQMNQGLEAMATDPERELLYFAPEAPLSQQSRTNYVPLYKMSVRDPSNPKPLERFEYPLDSTHETGVVAMSVLESNVLITLERGFDPIAREAVVRMYRVSLPDSPKSGDVLQKQLILDFKNLKSQLAAGFQSVENYEGLAIGPELPTGERLVFVVSDNNFSLSQRTMLLGLAIRLH